jgi:hypothetical protein
MQIDVKTRGPQPICERVIQLRAELLRTRQAPVEVLFSTEGYRLALAHKNSIGSHFSAPSGTDVVPATYMGLPFRTVPEQAELVVLRAVPGGSDEAREFRASRRAADQAIAGNNLARARMVRMVLANDALREALGTVATVAQLSDVIMAFVRAHPNEQPMTDVLVDWVQTHGRFE